MFLLSRPTLSDVLKPWPKQNISILPRTTLPRPRRRVVRGALSRTGRVMVVKVHSVGFSQSLGSSALSPQDSRWARFPPELPNLSRSLCACAACRMLYGVEARNTFGTMSCALASRRPRHTGWAPDMADCKASLEASPKNTNPAASTSLAAAPRRALTWSRTHAAGDIVHQKPARKRAR